MYSSSSSPTPFSTGRKRDVSYARTPIGSEDTDDDSDEIPAFDLRRSDAPSPSPGRRGSRLRLNLLSSSPGIAFYTSSSLPTRSSTPTPASAPFPSPPTNIVWPASSGNMRRLSRPERPTSINFLEPPLSPPISPPALRPPHRLASLTRKRPRLEDPDFTDSYGPEESGPLAERGGDIYIPSSQSSDEDELADGFNHSPSRTLSLALPTSPLTLPGDSSPPPIPSPAPQPPPMRRTFPSTLPINPHFPAFYHRFPLPSLADPTSPPLPDVEPNPLLDRRDLYTPRWVKGSGKAKVGVCPLCAEPTERGGEGKVVIKALKTSAYNYHLQYAHGISPLTHLPFSPPRAFRTKARRAKNANEKHELEEGQCHKCLKWVEVEGVKDVAVQVPEIYWWKHAAACHKGSTISGETDVFVVDEVLRELEEEEEG